MAGPEMEHVVAPVQVILDDGHVLGADVDGRERGQQGRRGPRGGAGVRVAADAEVRVVGGAQGGQEDAGGKPSVVVDVDEHDGAAEGLEGLDGAVDGHGVDVSQRPKARACGGSGPAGRGQAIQAAGF